MYELAAGAGTAILAVTALAGVDSVRESAVFRVGAAGADVVFFFERVAFAGDIAALFACTFCGRIASVVAASGVRSASALRGGSSVLDLGEDFCTCWQCVEDRAEVRVVENEPDEGETKEAHDGVERRVVGRVEARAG